MKNKIVLIFILILSFFGSCIGPKETNLLQDIKENYPTDDVAPLDYRIIEGDQLELSIYTLDESMKSLFSAFIVSVPQSMSTSSTSNMSIGGENENIPFNVLNVSSSGKIKIPYIGEVDVLDKTVLEAKKIIVDKFKTFSPNVNVDITLRNRYFFVLGAMGAKSVQMPRLRMNIFQVLAQNGGMQMYADRKNVKIVRQMAGGRTVVKVFDLRSKDIVNSDYYYIQPNDVIYMPESQKKFFGAATSFTGIFALITSFAGTVFGVWALVDRLK